MIGERLNELRKDMGITQDDLAKALSLTKFTISSYEKDKSTPCDEIKVQIAKYFNVSLDYLLGLVSEPHSFIRDRNVVELPKILSEADKREIREYIEFKTERTKRRTKNV